MRGIPRYTLVWGARYTLGARYLSKNTVLCFKQYSVRVGFAVQMCYDYLTTRVGK